MAESGQSFKTHVRFFPPFHFFVAPVLLINVFVTGWLLYRAPSRLGAWQLIVAVALFVSAVLAPPLVVALPDPGIPLAIGPPGRGALPAHPPAPISPSI